MGSRGSKYFIGLILSGAIAGSFAFLFKSKKGKEMREDLKIKKDELISRADDYIVKAKSKADEWIKEAQVNADSILKDANKIFKLAKESTSAVYEKTRGELEEEIARLRKAIKASIESYNRKLEEEKPPEVIVDNLFNESFLHPDTHDRKKSSDRQFHKMKVSMDIDDKELE
jgi:gas vesicle protein